MMSRIYLKVTTSLNCKFRIHEVSIIVDSSLVALGFIPDLELSDVPNVDVLCYGG
jgi:hypothetical protein